MTAVSVVIATRNRIDHLREAVASVERQTFDGWELVIVDDESTDETTEWASSHPDPRVRCVRLDRHVERSAARNLGVAEARGGYVLFLDDDDRLRPTALERLATALAGDAQAVAAVGAYALADEGGNRLRGFHPRRRLRRMLWRDALFDWNAPQGRTLYRTDAFGAAGGFPEHLSFAEDRDLWFRVTRLGPVVSIPEVVVDYRIQHAGRDNYADGLAAVDRVVDAHIASLDATDRLVAERMASVRRAWLDGSRSLTELDGRRAVTRFLAAIRHDPSVLRSPFVRPQLVRPLGKSVLCLMIGKRGMLLVRRAASWSRRQVGRDVSSKRDATERPAATHVRPAETQPADVRLPIHVAVHYIGAVSALADGVGVPSRAGAFVESLAGCVRHVTIVAYEQPTAPGFEDGVEYVVRAPNVSILSLGPKGSWRDYRERRRRVARIVADTSAGWDVLLFYFLPNRRASLVYAANRCPNVVSFVVGTVALGTLPEGAGVARRLTLGLGRYWTLLQLRAVIGRSGLVVVNSEELRESLPAPARNVRVVLLAARRRSHRWRAEDRFQGPNANVMVAGRMTFEKGVLEAIDAFAILKKHLPEARLHLAGDGPALDAMLDHASALGVRTDVITHGWVPAGDALFSLMREMDVFLMPSHADYEGFPQVIWEALAHSVLVVSTSVRGPRDVLEHERHVLFVPMRDPAKMAEAILRLARDPALRRRLLDEGFTAAAPVNVDATVAGILAGIAETWPALAASARL